MQIRQLLRNDENRAVSPVIGVILMVAITVILAAVIGTFVLGLGDQVQDTSPNSQFSFDYDSGADQLDVHHEGGDPIDAGNLYLRGDVQASGTDDSWIENTGTSEVTAGDGATVDGNDGSGYYWAHADGAGGYESQEGDTIRVVWEHSSGEQSTVLRTWDH